MKVKAEKFRDYLREKLKDPKFREGFKRERKALEIAMQMAEIRRKKRLSQKELARRMKTRQQVISRLESGDYEGYTLRTLERFAKATGTHLVIELRT